MFFIGMIIGSIITSIVITILFLMITKVPEKDRTRKKNEN